MAADRKTEPKLAEVAAKTTAALETLRSRLKREASPQESPAIEAPEVLDELGWQLEQYFASETVAPSTARRASSNGSAEIRISHEIRDQVIAGVVDRILRSWDAPEGGVPASIKSEVIARVVEQVLAELLKNNSNPR